jgi:glycerate kinase
MRLGSKGIFGMNFLGTRKKLKANNSIRGVNTLLNRIEKFVTKGQSATAMIEEANAQGWKTVYEEKEEAACTTNRKATTRRLLVGRWTHH